MHGATTGSIRQPVKTVDQDRFFPFFISTIANKISRGGSRIYLRLFGIGVIEWRIMYVLAEAPGVTAQTICNRIELDKAAASRGLQVLERLGYVQTAVDPHDARKRTLALTPAGVALHDRVLQVSFQREQQLLRGFTPAEREQLLKLLRRMHANAVAMDQMEFSVSEAAASPPGEVVHAA